MNEIIKVVTTPFAFATLLVLVVSGLYQVNRRRKGNPINAYSFALILIFGILANLSFIAKDFWFADARLQGEIRQANGRPITNATLDLSGVGRTASNENGKFELSIPYSQQQKKYSLYPFVNGIPGARIEVEGPTPPFLSVAFNSDAKIEEYISPYDNIQIGQNLGIPIINVLFRTNSQIDGRIKMSVSQVNVRRGDDVFSFFPWYITRGGMFIPTPELIIDYENQGAEYMVSTETEPSRPMQIGQDLLREFGFSWASTCLSSGVAPNVEARLRSIFNSNFFWAAGNYELSVAYRIEGKIKEKKYSFRLSAQESGKMKAMEGKLKNCSGMALDPSLVQWLNYSDGSANNIAMVRLTPAVP